MLVNYKKLINLPVLTESGQKLGSVYDLTINVETHDVQVYLVRFGFFNRQVYLIKPIQIINITNDKIIVEDNVLKQENIEGEEEKSVSSILAGVSQITEE